MQRHRRRTVHERAHRFLKRPVARRRRNTDRPVRLQRVAAGGRRAQAQRPQLSAELAARSCEFRRRASHPLVDPGLELEHTRMRLGGQVPHQRRLERADYGFGALGKRVALDVEQHRLLLDPDRVAVPERGGPVLPIPLGPAGCSLEVSHQMEP